MNVKKSGVRKNKNRKTERLYFMDEVIRSK